MKIVRCSWVNGSSEIMMKYHDEEWGVPLRDEHRLFEAIVLDGAQAGLSWSTILNRREGYRQAFQGFDPRVVARFNERTIQKLLRDPGIIRNEAKVRSAVQNAKATLALYEAGTTLAQLLWSFVNDKPVHNKWRVSKEIPADSPVSVALSKELKKCGFNFVGPTIVYALMQAAGLVNDHLVGCFRYKELLKIKKF